MDESSERHDNTTLSSIERRNLTSPGVLQLVDKSSLLELSKVIYVFLVTYRLLHAPVWHAVNTCVARRARVCMVFSTHVARVQTSVRGTPRIAGLLTL